MARAAGDPREAFGRYEALLRPFIEGKQKSAAGFATTFAPRTAFGVALRNAMTRLLAVPPIARLLIGRTMRDDFALPDYDM